MEPQVNTYSCPHCAEKIQRQAVACRFCSRPVTWSLYLVGFPHDLPLQTLLKRLYDEFGKERYASYGAMRKAQEAPDSALLTGLNREEADLAARYVADPGGEAKLELDRDEFTPLATATPKKRPALQFLLAAAALALLATFYLHRQKTVPPTETADVFLAPTATPVQVAEKPLLPSIQPTAVPTSPRGPSDEIKLHLRSLIQATATLSGNGVTGSAFFIHSSGYLISNHHVTQRMKEISVTTSDGKKRTGRLIETDAHLDLALVKVDGGPYPTLSLGDATVLEQGEAVWTIGAPHGLSFTVTRGIVSYVGRNVKGKAYIQADVAINPGNSGGPMINERGEVVAVNNFIISSAVGLNFAIPINYIYMGDHCIAENVIPTMRDNSVMARWRSWDENQQTLAAFEGDSFDEADHLLRESNELGRRYNQSQAKRQRTISNLKTRLNEKRKRYEERSATISEESAMGAEIRNLTRQTLQEQIASAEATLNYCNQQESFFKQILSAATDDQTSSQVQNALRQVQQLRSSTQATKETAQSSLDATEEMVY